MRNLNVGRLADFRMHQSFKITFVSVARCGWPVCLNGRAFDRDAKNRGFESRPVHSLHYVKT